MRRSRFALAFLAAGLALASVGVGAAKSPAKAPIFGLVSTGQESWKLVRLNPLTLGQRSGPSVAVDSRAAAWSFSPDRSKLVLADYDFAATLMLVDTQAMRRVGIVDTGGGALVSTTFWPDENRLYAVLTRLTRKDDGGYVRQPASLVAVDPSSRALVGERSLDGWVYGWAHGNGVLALLLGPESGIGPARLAVVGADGSVRTVGLDGIQVGADAFDESTPPAIEHYAQPGLAVAPDGSRAFVASPGGITVVDLRTLAVAHHGIALGGRQLQKGVPDGSTRTVSWVRDGVLAVSGRDDHSTANSEGLVSTNPRPVGVQLVSTSDWSAKMVDRAGEWVSIGADAMLVTPLVWNSARQRYRGSGATIYGLDGVKRAHVLGKRLVFGIVVGRRAFVEGDAPSYSVVSTKTGKILRTVKHPLPQPLVAAALDSN